MARTIQDRIAELRNQIDCVLGDAREEVERKRVELARAEADLADCEYQARRVMMRARTATRPRHLLAGERED